MTLNKNCLIGYSGTIGSHILEKKKFNYKYNSKNIEQIQKKNFDFTICCAAPGSMQFANKNPKEDSKKINNLMKYLRTFETKKFVLISTIQVYSKLNNKNNHEFSKKLKKKFPYGKNRRKLEIFCENRFDNILIIRLPSVFGKYIKKNFIFDIKNPMPTFIYQKKFLLIYKIIPKDLRKAFISIYKKKGNAYFINRVRFKKNLKNKKLMNFFEKKNLLSTSFTNPNSKYQFYNLKNIYKDISVGLKYKIKYLNLASEPIKASEIYRLINKKKMKPNGSKKYEANMISKYAQIWSSKKNYLYNKKDILLELKKLAKANV